MNKMFIYFLTSTSFFNAVFSSTNQLELPFSFTDQQIHNFTQSEAHMSLEHNKQLVEENYHLKENPVFVKFYNEALAKEKEFKKTHYVFYRAFTNEWRVNQELYFKLFEKLSPLSLEYDHEGKYISLSNFKMFKQQTTKEQTAQELLIKELKLNGLINDNTEDIKSFLLSTNIAFFGNVGFPGEDTFNYFLNAISQTRFEPKYFKKTLDIFDDPKDYAEGQDTELYKYLPEISELYTLLTPEAITFNPSGKKLLPQTLSQIFIKKEDIDSIGYPSWVQGIPFEDELVNWVEETLRTKDGLLVPSYKDIEKRLAEIRKLFKNDPNNKVFKLILDKAENGKYKLSQTLEQYMKDPNLILNLNYIQARLIVTPKYLANPSAGIHTFIYDNVSEENKKAYEKKLDNLVNEIFKTIREKGKRQAIKES